jgi:choline dehydrogenase
VVWPYTSEGEPELGGRRLFLPRGRTLGGSSTINGMLYARGHPLDFDQWRQMGCEGWSYADVLPYFKRSEASWRGEGPYHGAAGPVAVSPVETSRLLYEPVIEAARRCGYPTSDDLHGDQPEGFARAETTTTPQGRRASTATAYLDLVRHRPNLTILTGAQATRVHLEGRKAIGIEYQRGSQRFTARATREVILSGGAINSPHLLLLSGIGPANELRDQGIEPVCDLPGVGRNLSEHASFYVEYATREPISFLKELRADKVALAMARWLLLGTGLFASQATTCNALVRTRPELERPDIQFFFNPVRLDARTWFPGIRPVQEHLINAIIILLHPESRGSVRLGTADPLASPRIALNLLSRRADIDTLIRGFRIARKIYATAPLADLVDRETRPGAAVETDAEIEAYIREGLNVSYHPVGTCTMGHGPDAVVDPQLRVHGIGGLRVADASIMPTVPGGNTNMPTIMIGEKAADLVRGRSLPAGIA